MSQISYRANVNSGHFPFLAQQHGQTVIIPGRDQAFQNQIVVNQDSEDKDKGFPQLYYCHNVMPTIQGIQSTGFTKKLSGIVSTAFDDIFTLRDIDENKFLFSPAAGNNYVYNGNNGAWLSAGGATVTSSAIITIAYINGRTFVFYQNDNLYEYNSGTGLFDIVALTGVVAANLKGVCASSGFLIMWDDFTVYRSQPTDILNFTPDPALGSGSSIPEPIKGQILVCLTIANGFIIYTSKNAVSATFSKNIRYPFDYAEVQGSAGIIKASHVAWQNNVGLHYAWTIAGLQKIDKVRAVSVFPEVTDFLTAKIFEDYDTITNTFTETKLSTALEIKLNTVATRFLCISYGVTFPYTHALVYDLALKRWGKLKFTHVAIFELSIPNPIGGTNWNDLGTLLWSDLGDTSWNDFASGASTQEQPKETLALLTQSGDVYIVNFDDVHTGDSGVALLGKYQFVRERYITIQEIEFENIDAADNFVIKQLSSINGKTISQISTPYLDELNGQYRRYLNSVEAKNHSLSCQGTFNFNTISLVLTVGGNR